MEVMACALCVILLGCHLGLVTWVDPYSAVSSSRLEESLLVEILRTAGGLFSVGALRAHAWASISLILQLYQVRLVHPPGQCVPLWGRTALCSSSWSSVSHYILLEQCVPLWGMLSVHPPCVPLPYPCPLFIPLEQCVPLGAVRLHPPGAVPLWGRTPDPPGAAHCGAVPGAVCPTVGPYACSVHPPGAVCPTPYACSLFSSVSHCGAVCCSLFTSRCPTVGPYPCSLFMELCPTPYAGSPPWTVCTVGPYAFSVHPPGVSHCP